MIKVSVLYPHEDGFRFDMDYYVNKHVAMIRGLLGDALRKAEIDEGIAGRAPDSAPPFVAAVHMYFDSVEAFQTAFFPHGKAIAQDVPNYTSLKPTMQIARVVSS